MSCEQQSRRKRKIPFLVIPLGFLSAAAGFLILGCGGTPTAGPSAQGQAESEETVRKNIHDALARAPDLDTCRAALEQLNTFLGKQPERKFGPLSPDESNRLKQRFGLVPEEVDDLDSASFTVLDSHHLAWCLLVRDSTRMLGLKAPPSLEQARQAFAFVMREVRLRPGEGDPLPPEYVLRRGWGTAEERALVFLALLHQLRMRGCMLAYETKVDGKPLVRYWLAGALLEKQIYLFDIRLGLPLPGPKGQGIATLDQLKQPNGADILHQLASNPKHPYGVTPEQIKRVEVQVVCPLSALAPRMHYLQSDVLGFDLAADTVQVAAEAKLFEPFEEATRSLGVSVRTWEAATRALRSFLPREEGGADRSEEQQRGSLAREKLFKRNLVPMHVLPYQIANLPGEGGQRLQNSFAQRFVDFYLGPHMPRDLMLRGRLDEATKVLVAMWQELTNQQPAAGLTRRQLQEELARWSKVYVQASADLIDAEQAAGGAQSPRVVAARDKLEKTWKDGLKPMSALLILAVAELSGGEVTYHLALCKQEQAERAQARAGGKGTQAAVAESNWKEAVYWWEKYENDYLLRSARLRSRLQQIRQIQKEGGQELAKIYLEYLGRDLSTAINARLLHAHARACLHQPTVAVALLEDMTRELTDLEASGDLTDLEGPDHQGPCLSFLTGVSYRIQQVKQSP